MKFVDLVVGQVFISEGLYLAKKVMIDVVSVNQVVVITHDADFAEDFHLHAKFFSEFSYNCFVDIFSGLRAAAGGFDQRRSAEFIIPDGSNEVEHPGFIHDDCTNDCPVMVGVGKRPFRILQFYH